ncbi:MAG: GNAT family N-acetyltransferase [Pseudonocardiales bacterium]|nr:MAG: GNAT family N-acetyltransferase [Pseudonocardiales bacterium]
MDVAAVLARYDRQLRRDATALPPARIERDGAVIRWLNDAEEGGWEAVFWSDLDESTADAQIAHEKAYFTARRQRFEWKHHAYDRPADLPARLIAAGFEPEEEEALVVAEIAGLAADFTVPDGIELVPVTDAAGVERVVAVHNEVFGIDHSWLRREMLAKLGNPEAGVAVLAMAGDRAVCAARVDFHPGTDFASLWGGGTLPEWRGRGIYRALVGYRARLAAERGFRYLQVDSSPDSQPILRRLGFVDLTTTTPYVYTPPSVDNQPP